VHVVAGRPLVLDSGSSLERLGVDGCVRHDPRG
jgi:hypothetical protein